MCAGPCNKKNVVLSQNKVLVSLVFSPYLKSSSEYVVSSPNTTFAPLCWTEWPLWVAVLFWIVDIPLLYGPPFPALLFLTTGGHDGEREVSPISSQVLARAE